MVKRSLALRVPKHPLNPVTGLKECSKCSVEKTADDFCKNIKAADGLDCQCRECRNAMKRKHKEDNPERYKQIWLTWRAANLPRLMWHNCKLRARNRSIACTITPDDIHVPVHCPVCGQLLVHNQDGKKHPTNSSPSVDAWVPSAGYTPENIWVICMECNTRKRDMSATELIEFGQRLIEAFGEVQQGREKALVGLELSGIS